MPGRQRLVTLDLGNEAISKTDDDLERLGRVPAR
jgi:hypothetical protein